MFAQHLDTRNARCPTSAQISRFISILLNMRHLRGAVHFFLDNNPTLGYSFSRRSDQASGRTKTKMSKIEILKAFATGKMTRDMKASNAAIMKEMHREGLLTWSEGIYGWGWQISVTGRDLVWNK